MSCCTFLQTHFLFDKQAKIAASRAAEEENELGDEKKRPIKGGRGGGGCVIS